MIDYYEIKSQPITRLMVVQAYKKVKANKGSAGIDEMSWAELDKDLKRQLYKLWNRLTSGSYFPKPVREVEIKKKSGGIRKLGIPTILDRIAQEVVKVPLERIVEPLFHDSSYGYRPQRSCHQAVEKAMQNAMKLGWAIDLDIKSFFDTINHESRTDDESSKTLLYGQVDTTVRRTMVKSRNNAKRWNLLRQTDRHTTRRRYQSLVSQHIPACRIRQMDGKETSRKAI